MTTPPTRTLKGKLGFFLCIYFIPIHMSSVDLYLVVQATFLHLFPLMGGSLVSSLVAHGRKQNGEL